MFDALIDPLISVLYPQQCHVCGGGVESLSNGVACESCWGSTRIFSGAEPLCETCGAMVSQKGQICLQCGDAGFDQAIASGVYENALAATVVDLKKQPYIAKRAAKIFADRVRILEIGERSVVIPVPLSRKRKFERGFNQAEILASIVARELELPLLTNRLLRTSHTQLHRIGMDKKARAMTVDKAFEIASSGEIDGRNVILVDDVLTSGSTASACARVLKKHGGGRVTVVTLARAVL